ncbi:MAG: hypothetical protein CSA81_04750 [Acidobacteria bacterium]|nr:MAG: hypothetical protein CSA81_04750 [Acidobacteriota bacterium]
MKCQKYPIPKLNALNVKPFISDIQSFNENIKEIIKKGLDCIEFRVFSGLKIALLWLLTDKPCVFECTSANTSFFSFELAFQLVRFWFR